MPDPAPAPQQAQQGQNAQEPQAQQRQQTGGISWNVRFLQELMVGFIIVMFIGFAAAFIAVGGIIVNYEAAQQATYQDLKDQVVMK